MPPSAGKHPPERPVPAPRATNGRFSRFASLTTAETCWAEVGKTMKSASARNRVRPSDSYTISSSGSERTAPRPTIVSSSRRSSSFLESVRVGMGLTELYLTRQHARRSLDGGGVDPVVPIEIGPRARLPEVVNAERQLGHAERRPDDRERVRRAGEPREGIEQDPFDLTGECRLPEDDPGEREADPRRDHRLMRAALGRQRDARRRRRHDEARARIEGVVERVEPAGDERIVERADRQPGPAETLARAAE